MPSWKDISGFWRVIMGVSAFIIASAATVTAFDRIEPLLPSHRSYVREVVDVLRPDVRRAERRLLEDRIERSWAEDLNLKLQRQRTTDGTAHDLIDQRLLELNYKRQDAERDLDAIRALDAKGK